MQQDAVDKGWFRESPTVTAPPSIPIILTTAREIASAMAFLHGQGIIHGDLTGGMASHCPPQHTDTCRLLSLS